jgi:hypothetical protein
MVKNSKIIIKTSDGDSISIPVKSQDMDIDIYKYLDSKGDFNYSGYSIDVDITKFLNKELKQNPELKNLMNNLFKEYEILNNFENNIEGLFDEMQTEVLQTEVNVDIIEEEYVSERYPTLESPGEPAYGGGVEDVKADELIIDIPFDNNLSKEEFINILKIEILDNKKFIENTNNKQTWRENEYSFLIKLKDELESGKIDIIEAQQKYFLNKNEDGELRISTSNGDLEVSFQDLPYEIKQDNGKMKISIDVAEIILNKLNEGNELENIFKKPHTSVKYNLIR